jgi:hypothetical protein
MMQWKAQGNRYLSGPYHIHRDTRGFAVWYKTRDRYGILVRELDSLAKAKEFCETHRANGRQPIPRPHNEGEGEVS